MINSRVIETKNIDWQSLQFIQDDNFKEWVSDGDAKLMQSIVKYQFVDPFKVWNDGTTLYCLDGKHRWLDLKKAKESGEEVPDLLPATFIDCVNMKEAAELVLVYSSAYAKITEKGLLDYFEKYDLSFPELKDVFSLSDLDMVEFESSLKEMAETDLTSPIGQSLQERFIAPPFSVLDTRQGYWQERKKQWHALGFDSQETREEVELISRTGQAPAVYELRNKMREKLGREPEWNEILDYAKQKGLHLYEGASIFDPVLAEICYTWFCPEKAIVLDPFAGGSVRGIVAAMVGTHYVGIDLRKEQVSANDTQFAKLKKQGAPLKGNAVWYEGDSNIILDELNESFDFVFSCPPYHDLEKYSDDPADLSNMTYEQFKDVYTSIIAKSIAKLKDNRFACFVVGDIRDKQGFYKSFVPDTIKAFEDAGAHYYNEIILVNVAGSLPTRIGRQFGGFRKVGKMHQNVLVFYKGDPKKIKDDFPEIKVSEALEELNNNPNITSSTSDS